MTEQPNPKPNDEPEVWPAVIAMLEAHGLPEVLSDNVSSRYGGGVLPLVLADMRARDSLGRECYGVPLQPFNGRDAMRDLYDELLDACAYSTQADMECERARFVRPGGITESVLRLVIEVRAEMELRVAAAEQMGL